MKRLIGLPGDTVEVRLRNGDGYVYINGKPLKEPYIEKARRGAVQCLRAGRGQARELLHDGRQPVAVVRFAPLGHRAARRT